MSMQKNGSRDQLMTIEDGGFTKVFICGSAMRGQPDNHNLKGARFVAGSATVPVFRLHAVGDGWHPGIYQVAQGGVSISGEIYELTTEQFAHLKTTEPPHLYPEAVQLTDGSTAIAFLYPKELVDENRWPDISDFGGWAPYKKATGD